jgi:hypothetical protein
MLDRSQNQPGAQSLFLPPDMIRPATRVPVPAPTSKPGNSNGQY